jgi:hypothetical protein
MEPTPEFPPSAPATTPKRTGKRKQPDAPSKPVHKAVKKIKSVEKTDDEGVSKVIVRIGATLEKAAKDKAQKHEALVSSLESDIAKLRSIYAEAPKDTKALRDMLARSILVGDEAVAYFASPSELKENPKLSELSKLVKDRIRQRFQYIKDRCWPRTDKTTKEKTVALPSLVDCAKTLVKEATKGESEDLLRAIEDTELAILCFKNPEPRKPAAVGVKIKTEVI